MQKIFIQNSRHFFCFVIFFALLTNFVWLSSRLSLAGSRQSLLGSHSQLASPGTERPTTSQSIASISDKSEKKSNMSPPEYSSTSKRESFVEVCSTFFRSSLAQPNTKYPRSQQTRFLETLTPQFIPGHSLTTPSGASAEDKLSALQQQQQIDDLKLQVRDLTEKLETLKQRRNEDKERLREFDKKNTQFEQMQEFKAKIMDAQSQLQRELQRARQETKDAIDARDQHIEEMSELAENVELITLDKEMAEEKADTLQVELTAAKERCEELQLDLEILKNEMQNKLGSKYFYAEEFRLRFSSIF